MSIRTYVQKNRVVLPKHILGIEDLNPDQINYVIGLANEIKLNKEDPKEIFSDILNQIDGENYFHFNQPSSRTRTSSCRASRHLGMKTSYIGPKESSEEKGESLEDTITTYEENNPAIIGIRGNYDFTYHSRDGLKTTYDSRKSLSNEFLNKTNARLVNLGDNYQHPTQTLLDLMGLMNEANVKDVRELDLNIVLVGSTEGYRATQSLVKALKKYTKCKVRNIVPYGGKPMNSWWGAIDVIELEKDLFPNIDDEDLYNSDRIFVDYAINDEVRYQPGIISGKKLELMKDSRRRYVETVKKSINDADILYFVRSTQGYKSIIDGTPPMVHRLTKEFLDDNTKPSMKIMHPLPRGEELSNEHDSSPRNLYFDLMSDGYYLRKSLFLAMLIEPLFKDKSFQATLAEF